MWLSKQVAELHGGIVGVESEGEGKGSCFYLDLPRFQLKLDSSKSMCKPISQAPSRVPSFNELAKHDHTDNHIPAAISPTTYTTQLNTNLNSSKTPTSNSTPINGHNNINNNTTSYISPRDKIADYIHKSNDNSDELLDKQLHDNTNTNTNTNQNDQSILPITVKRVLSVNVAKDKSKNNKINPLDLSIESERAPYLTTTIMELATKQKYNILCCDDMPLIRKMVERALYELSNVFDHASDGSEAVALVTSKNNLKYYEVILMDAYMPKVSQFNS